MDGERLQDVVSVVIPTQALARRRELIRRAIGSVRNQAGVRAVPIVVVNGPHRDPELTSELCADRSLRVAVQQEPDLTAALALGRRMVDTPWFAELDDDDLLVNGALALRVDALRRRAGVDAVVTNGLRRTAAGDTPSIADASFVERDPLRALVLGHINWLLPGSWLCRTDTVGAEFFAEMPRFRECTYLAIRLAATRRIVFLQQPTVIWHADTPLSESKSEAYVLAGPSAARRMLELDLPPDVRAALRRHVAPACHNNAHHHLKRGLLQKAWDWHLQSLREPGGWRHLPYTRYFIYAALGH